MESWMINVILIVFAVWFLAQRMMPTKGVRNISTQELKSELNDRNKQFIDVRTPAEFKGNHIKEFKNIPLHLLTQKATELVKDKEVIVICQSGMRSNKATKTLKKLGFSNVTNVKGGMSAW
jgi:rhodanese-related sulfurtransferase